MIEEKFGGLKSGRQFSLGGVLDHTRAGEARVLVTGKMSVGRVAMLFGGRSASDPCEELLLLMNECTPMSIVFPAPRHTPSPTGLPEISVC